MEVIAKKNFVVNGKIYQRGNVYEIGDVPFDVWKAHGWIEEVNVIDEPTDSKSGIEGLPPLDEVATPARKRK